MPADREVSAVLTSTQTGDRIIKGVLVTGP
jgi:hypothetical protein